MVRIFGLVGDGAAAFCCASSEEPDNKAKNTAAKARFRTERMRM